MFGKFIEDNFPSIAEKINGMDSLLVVQALFDDFFEAYVIQIALGGLIIFLTLAYWLYTKSEETESFKFSFGFYLSVLSSIALILLILLLLTGGFFDSLLD